MAHDLDVFSFPLHGQRLIEASAGTGKTYTITGLYLRLLLGHGDNGAAHQMPLSVENILVVTFTEAATQELRDRIRKRIHQARRAFEKGETSDPVLKRLLEDIKERKAAAKILLNAERQMDEAAIYTIHGFCQRMLTQNAFESGSLFSNEFITNEDELRLQATADFWRREFYSADKSLASVLRSYWKCPESLLSNINSYLSGSLVKIIAPDISQSLTLLHEQNIERIDAVKKLWLGAKDIEDIISKSGVDKRSYNFRNLTNWLEQISKWAGSKTLDYQLPENLERFSSAAFAQKTKKGEPPTHPVFDAIEAFELDKPSLKEVVIAYAIKEVRQILSKEKQRFSRISFDDLLANLADALAKDEEGILAARIRSLYPVAMIDEFQDTDPQQYQIFSKVYQNDEKAGLAMIGDPKQAIYAFRGADIFTYIAARRAVIDHYNLGVNWRSTADMVAAANHIFEFGKKPFIYEDDIPFIPVKSALNADKNHWLWNGEKQAALRIWFDENQETPIGKGVYQDEMVRITAIDICDLLNASANKQACFVKNGKERSIQPRDIAVLVRTGREAALIKKELAKYGIASVYLSDRNSVFSSAIAKDVERILNAVLTPEDERTLRAALSCALFALTAEQIDNLNNSEQLWEQAALEFIDYQETWFSKGVLPMLRQMIYRRKIAQRLLGEEEGERQLTDLMHLGELLQQASGELESHYALLRWFIERIQNPNGNSEEQQVRLESERDLVQIVTIHKSKGLEYNLVYLPFICGVRETKAPFYHDKNHQAVLDLNNQDKAIEEAEKERLAEDLRLLYVAVTRAVFGCVLGIAPLKLGRGKSELTDLHKSAIGYLLQQGKQLDPTGLTKALEDFAHEQPNIALGLPQGSTDKYVPPIEESDELIASQFAGNILRDWRLTSYSGLVKQGHSSALEAPTFDIDAANEEQAETVTETAEEELAPFSSIFQFPRGARPGTFLHTLFENVVFDTDLQSEEVAEIIERQLIRENYPKEWLGVLQKLLVDVLQTELTSQMRLGDIHTDHCLAELEFVMPVTRLNSYSLNAIIKEQDELSSQAGELNFKTASGMLKGFIDLVFCFEGRYFVLDWKSNYLGDRHEDYHQQALSKAMIEHRYDFQYQIYTLALHRFLRSRIKDYAYEKHIGGVFYLFVRGMQANTSNGIFHTKPSKALIDKLDLLFADGVQYVG